MKEFENQFLLNYESDLAEEGSTICKEVDDLFGNNKELLAEKARAYCDFVKYTRSDVDTKLLDRCKKYLNEMRNYNEIKKYFRKYFKKQKNGLKNNELNSSILVFEQLFLL